MSKPSLIHELQSLAQVNSTDIGELLRRGKVVAAKLKLPDFQAWLDHEMTGYPLDSEIPPYRKIHTQLMSRNPYHGLQPVMFTGGWISKHFSSMDMREPISQVAHLVASDDGEGQLECGVSSEELKVLLKVSNDFRLMPPVRIVNKSGMVGILEAVRNRILQWALDLEGQGVLGEGMTFSVQEQQAAAAITINNYGPVGAVMGNSEGDVNQPHNITNLTNSNSPNSNLAAGQHINQSITTGIAAGDLTSLLNHLREAKVSDADLKELTEALKAEPKPKDDGTLGERVGGWIGKMTQKAITGTWKIAVTEGVPLVVKAIGAYYGVPA